MDPSTSPNYPKETVEEEIQGDLTPSERVWASRFEFLKDHGYLLRHRYRPGWKPHFEDVLELANAEDGLIQLRENVLDAVRLPTNKQVFLKCVSKDDPEMEIDEYIRSLPTDPHNHCVPFLDVLRNPAEPGVVILVLPLLRNINRPPIASLREAVDAVQQTLEGLVFLHEHKVAHRDCNWPNIMMDGSALYPRGWHPAADWKYPNGRRMGGSVPSRTAVGGVRYYFVDFGISSIAKDLVTGSDGQVRAPELSDDTPYNPYLLDVYILGKAYNSILIHGTTGAECLAPLVEHMTKENPLDRPTAAKALAQFQEIRTTLKHTQLSERLLPTSEPRGFGRLLGDLHYRLLELWWSIKGNN